MEQYYLAMLGFLAVIAVIDLYVGVSNDAVNFLNSAIGCRIASFRTTMWVASIGVLLGATFSSGMMEIARSGIFNPQMFSFTEIMVIFLAVMAADVILLDAFNSLGLPTSTTVSIVFELLGSAAAAAAWKLISDGASLTELYAYINTGKSLGIISGILISVAVAFVAGAAVQYLARLIFTFHFERAYRRFGGLFAAFSITAIIYFLVMKGAKGASFMRPEWLDWINANTCPILLTLLIGLAALFQAAILLLNVNVFKVIILAGTFSLAFAFAGNDLVNFVGVPIAAWDSWKLWSASQTGADAFMMESLLKPASASTFILILSGLVMVLTLWFSKKARRVIQTSISLSSSQASEHEQFGASLPGRMIVRAGMGAGNLIRQLIPMSAQRALKSRFEPVTLAHGEAPLPFDYVRASINLVISAILIASATSLKLPLSTTYVTFMVAMGSSFADGAWDRETAVYRVSGVLTVITGWFITAICASTLAALVASLLLWGGPAASVVICTAAIALLIRSNMKKPEEAELEKLAGSDASAAAIERIIGEKAPENLGASLDIFGDIVTGILSDREKALRNARSRASALFDDITRARSGCYRMAMTDMTPSKSDLDARYSYFRAFTNMREASRSLLNLSSQALDHVANRHRVFTGKHADELTALLADLNALATSENGQPDPGRVSIGAGAALERIDALQTEMLSTAPGKTISVHGQDLYFAILHFARELVTRYAILNRPAR